jgi:hypothetical protein
LKILFFIIIFSRAQFMASTKFILFKSIHISDIGNVNNSIEKYLIL